MELSTSEETSPVPLQSSSMVQTDNEIHPAVSGMANLPISRQIGVMVGLALSIAMAVAIVLWSQTPDYTLLYGNVADRDVAEILDALEKRNIDYKVAPSSGAIMVPTEDVYETRLNLANQGLPKDNSIGFELMEKDTGFGTSQRMEQARFHRALEGEIARSISSIQSVKSARVHLALPKQSVFLRTRKKPSASVLVHLYSGRVLVKGQIDAIVHLVASSVPQLEAEQVTLVNQKGHLLSATNNSDEMYLSSKQFDYKKQVESHLMERIENILSPVLGGDGLRTQVTADVDFTITEQTHESFNPDLPALRSEQTSEDQSRLSAIQGVPGALSNQPPASGTAPEIAQPGDAQNNGASINSSKNITRNYELDKTISHTRLASGLIRRLTVAVVIDDQHLIQEDGSVLSKPFSEEDLARFTELVKQAIGFDTVRGDTVTVTNTAFKFPTPLEPLPDLPLWEQGWFKTLLKQLAAVLVVLLVIFAVIRPVMRGLVAHERSNNDPSDEDTDRTSSADIDAKLAEEQLALAQEEDPLLLEAPQSYEKRLEFAQKMVDDDPKRVSQVMKGWIG